MRSRTVFFLALLMCGILLAVMAVGAPAATQDSAQPAQLGLANVQLIRCTAASDGICLRFDLNVVDASGSPANIPGSADPEHFQVIQAAPHRVLRPFLVRANEDVVSSVPPKRYVLVLFDVSGSMKNSLVPGGRRKIDVAREALSAGLDELSAGSDLVAIAPFENHNLDRISAVPFVPVDAVREQLQQLSVPRGQADTALYSAVVAGLELLARQPAKSERVLVVFTDGKNDVGDQRQLLSDDNGRDIVVGRARKSQLPIWTIGLGSGSEINEADLRQIAYPDAATHYIPATDAEGLKRAFKAATQKSFNRIRVTVELEDSFRKLVGADREFQVRFQTPDGKSLSTRPWIWKSPVSGLEPPSDFGEAAETKAYELANSHPEAPRLSRGVVQISTFLFYALLLSFLWFIVPRMVWPHRYQPDAEVELRFNADTPALSRPNRKHIEDLSLSREQEPLEIPDRWAQRDEQPARPGGSLPDRDDPGSLSVIFGEKNPESRAGEAKNTGASTPPGALTTIFGEKNPESHAGEAKGTPASTPAGAQTTIFGDSAKAHAAGPGEPGISKIFAAEEAEKDLRPVTRNEPEGAETLALPPRNLQKPQGALKEQAADLGSLKDRPDNPRWPEQNLEATGPVVIHRRTIDNGPGEHPVVIAGRRTKVSPTESIVSAPPPRNAADVPPAPSEPARKGLDPRFVLLLVLNLAFLLVAASLLYFSLKR